MIKPRARFARRRDIERGWGGPIGIEDIAPSLAGDEAFREWWGLFNGEVQVPQLWRSHM